jgi:N-methylhydantoinase A
MVQAISEITVNQGIDPADAVLIGGGGAAGLNATWTARRLRCPSVLIPETGAGLSAYGAMISDLSREYRTMFFTTSEGWDEAGVNRVLAQLEKRCQAFVDGPGAGAIESSIEFSVEARYAGQVWEIEVPLPANIFNGEGDLSRLIEDFHATHQEIFAINDPDSIVEMVGWISSVNCRLRKNIGSRLQEIEAKTVIGSRKIYFDGAEVTTPIYPLQSVPMALATEGPAIIETPYTTIVIDPAARFYRSEHGSVMILP